MDVRTVLKDFESKGKPHMEEMLARHGIEGINWCVSYADLGVLTKKYAGDHDLALGLWDAGIHDARVLATMIADPEAMTTAQITKWISQSTYHAISDAVSLTAARLSNAMELARKWVDSDSEWSAAAGWNVIGISAMKGRLDAAEAKALLGRLRKELRGERNRVKYSMNGAMIAIGGSIPSLRDVALDTARALGPVDVDHGKTACKTPDALSMIPKMAERQASKLTKVAPAKKSKVPKSLKKTAKPAPRAR